MNKDIKITNRYGYNHTLAFADENKYRFIPDTYMRLIYSDKECKNVKSIDPDGGPFISRGTIIDNLKIADIQHEEGIGIYLYTEIIKNN